MKSKRELNSLYGLYVACEGAMSYCYQLQKYEQNNPLVLDSKKKIHITSECYTKVSNIVTAVKKNKNIFSKATDELALLVEYVSRPVDVPDNMKDSFSENDDISLERVLRVSRNLIEHPEKNEQYKYALLAYGIPTSTVFQAFFYCVQLIKHELSFLSEEEKRIMFAESLELKLFFQNTKLQLEKLLPELEQDPKLTPEKKNMINMLMRFEPSDDNVFFDVSLPKREL